LGVAPPGEVIRFRGWAVLEERWTSGSCIANASVRFYGGTDAAPAFIVAPDTANALIASGSGGATVVVPVGTACSFMTKALQPVAGMGTIVGFGIHVTSLQPQDLTLDDAEFLRPMRNGLFSVSSGLATGADCTTGSCLSGLCAELADGGDRCLCAPPGVPCGANAGCCSLSCVGGRCQ
jgi:hypothetical protein